MKNKAFKYRIYPTNKQAEKLAQSFGCVRFVWNKSVEGFNERQNVNLNDLKDEYSFLGDVSCAILQQKMRDFIEYRRRYFKGGIGRPNFKKRSRYNSFRLPNQKVKFKDGRIRLEKIGWIKMVVDRPFEGRALSVTVSKNPAGQYYASVLCETEIKTLEPSDKVVGLDLGIKFLVATSDGEKVSNPKFLRDNQAEISRLQTFLAKKKRGSRRYEKLRIKIARLHQKVKNQREHFLHQITNDLISRYGVICVEDLDVANMKALGKHDASMGELVRQLEYKSDWYGREINRIDRFYPSSQTCSQCGRRKRLELTERTYSCVCGLEIDRDLNAALNIKVVGVNAAQRSLRASIV